MNKKILKILTSVVIILVCVTVINVGRFMLRSKEKDPLRISSRRVKGNPKALIQIVEYASYRCGHCGFGTIWLNKVVDQYPDDVYVEFRYFPLSLHDGAFASRFAECALRQRKFWEVTDALMSRQKEWMRLANAESFFMEIAKQHDLDIEALTVCWEDPSLYDAIIDIKHQGKQLGVSATPTYFINGKMLVGIYKLRREIASLLDVNEEDLPK